MIYALIWLKPYHVYIIYILTTIISSLPDDGLALTLQLHVPKEQNVVQKVEYYNMFPRNTIQELLHSSEVDLYNSNNLYTLFYVFS